MVHVGHFTLIDARRSQSVLFQEGQEDPEVPVEVGPNGFVIPRVLLAVAFLAPVLDEPIILNLDHLAPLLVGEGESGYRRVLEGLEFQPDTPGWSLRKLLNHRHKSGGAPGAM
jgi:hypothetical protein